MSRSFEIQKGNIVFEDERICINDRKYKWERYSSLIMAISAIVYGIMTLIHFLSTGGISEFSFTFLGILVVIGIPLIVYQIKMNVSPILRYDEIRKVTIRENPLGLLIADFTLRNKKRRHVVLDMNRENNFERNKLPEFVIVLKEKEIETEIK
jgi:hypothetical protein